jgi:type II secretory pathway component GspD/PulD (secretin)
LPRLRIRETQSSERVKFGEVIALRGPLAENIIHHKSKVPVLGDVPGLGRLFRNEGSETRRTRLYVFVVPESVAALLPSEN